jgi:hypothetical protein
VKWLTRGGDDEMAVGPTCQPIEKYEKEKIE